MKDKNLWAPPPKIPAEAHRKDPALSIVIGGRISAFPTLSFFSMIKGGGNVDNTLDAKWGKSDKFSQTSNEQKQTHVGPAPGHARSFVHARSMSVKHMQPIILLVMAPIL